MCPVYFTKKNSDNKMRNGTLRGIFSQRDYSKVRHFSEFRRLHSALAQRLTCQSVEVSEIRQKNNKKLFSNLKK